jgi:hypothetical protein
MVKMTKHFSNAAVGTSGAFMGFDTSESDDTETSDLEQGSRLLDDVSEVLAGNYQNIFKSFPSLNTILTSIIQEEAV